jgi:SagB-type dehydrogenase family enzyme
MIGANEDERINALLTLYSPRHGVISQIEEALGQPGDQLCEIRCCVRLPDQKLPIFVSGVGYTRREALLAALEDSAAAYALHVARRAGAVPTLGAGTEYGVACKSDPREARLAAACELIAVSALTSHLEGDGPDDGLLLELEDPIVCGVLQSFEATGYRAYVAQLFERRGLTCLAAVAMNHDRTLLVPVAGFDPVSLYRVALFRAWMASRLASASSDATPSAVSHPRVTTAANERRLQPTGVRSMNASDGTSAPHDRNWSSVEDVTHDLGFSVDVAMIDPPGFKATGLCVAMAHARPEHLYHDPTVHVVRTAIAATDDRGSVWAYSHVYGERNDPVDPAEAYHAASSYHPGYELPVPGADFFYGENPRPDEVDTPMRRRAGAVIRLPSVTLPEETFQSVLFDRRSERNFAGSVLTTSELSALLSASYGASGDMGLRRTTPSAGGLYPLDILVFANSVEGLERALYQYDPERHHLIRLTAIDRDEFARIYFADWLGDAAVAIALVAVFGRSRIKYGLRAYRLALIEAGHAGQNALLAARALRLTARPIGGFFDRRANDLLQVNGVDEAMVYAVVAGRPPGQTALV